MSKCQNAKIEPRQTTLVCCGNHSYYDCRVDRDARGVAAHQPPSVPDCRRDGRDDHPGGVRLRARGADSRHPRADGLLVTALEFTRWSAPLGTLVFVRFSGLAVEARMQYALFGARWAGGDLPSRYWLLLRRRFVCGVSGKRPRVPTALRPILGTDASDGQLLFLTHAHAYAYFPPLFVDSWRPQNSSLWKQTSIASYLPLILVPAMISYMPSAIIIACPPRMPHTIQPAMPNPPTPVHLFNSTLADDQAQGRELVTYSNSLIVLMEFPWPRLNGDRLSPTALVEFVQTQGTHWPCFCSPIQHRRISSSVVIEQDDCFAYVLLLTQMNLEFPFYRSVWGVWDSERHPISELCPLSSALGGLYPQAQSSTYGSGLHMCVGNEGRNRLGPRPADVCGGDGSVRNFADSPLNTSILPWVLSRGQHVVRSGSTWFNDLSRCDKPLPLTPPIRLRRRHPTGGMSIYQRCNHASVPPRPHGCPCHLRSTKCRGQTKISLVVRWLEPVTLIRVAPVRKPARTTPARTTAPVPTSNNDGRRGVAVASGAHSVQRKLSCSITWGVGGSVGRAARSHPIILLLFMTHSKFLVHAVNSGAASDGYTQKLLEGKKVFRECVGLCEMWTRKICKRDFYLLQN
ncbi:hypothetical protein B0H13DRAFT_1903293 [Mycena leptocephala]|nr:hypothetical protein B0H13DRAFT_1903293 [Mycena leptocephala]